MNPTKIKLSSLSKKYSYSRSGQDCVLQFSNIVSISDTEPLQTRDLERLPVPQEAVHPLHELHAFHEAAIMKIRN